MDREAPLVYSSHPEIFQKPAATPPEPEGLPPKGQAIKIRREKQGRAGKTVTALFEFQASDRQREALAKELRRRLGTGGTVKEGVIELQGDRMDRVAAILSELGYRPRKAGA